MRIIVLLVALVIVQGTLYLRRLNHEEPFTQAHPKIYQFDINEE
jgi:hypothetical protein